MQAHRWQMERRATRRLHRHRPQVPEALCSGTRHASFVHRFDGVFENPFAIRRSGAANPYLRLATFPKNHKQLLCIGNFPVVLCQKSFA
jgi:hypothetical protein